MDADNLTVLSEEIRLMMEAAAFSIVGSKVLVLMRGPVDSVFGAYVYRKKSGEFSMHISPSMSLHVVWEKFLHEMGHIVCGHVPEEGDEIDWDHIPSGTIASEWSEQEIQAYKQTPNEVEAQAFASAINQYATTAALSHFGNISIAARLRILMNVQLLPPADENDEAVADIQ